MTITRKFRRTITAATLAGAVLSSSSFASARWVMGATAFRQHTYFTGVITIFNVPIHPANGATATFSALFPGIESSKANYILQPVVAYNHFPDIPGWNIFTEAVSHVPGLSFGPCDRGDGTDCLQKVQTVSDGDQIVAGIELDSANLSGCNLSSGANCNYQIFYWDVTSGISATSTDFRLPAAPDFAQGMVYEVQLDGSPNCGDFPNMIVTPVTGTILLREFASTSDIFHDYGTTNLMGGAGPSGAPAGTFSFPALANGVSGSTCGFAAGVSNSTFALFGF